MKPIDNIIEQINKVNFHLDPLEELPSEEDTTEWFVPGLLIRGGVNYICSAPGHGKTLLAMDLTHSCTHGRKFLGLFNVPETRALIVDQDANSPRESNSRILSFGFRAGCGLMRMNQQGFRLDVAEDVAWLRDACQFNHIGIVIFDSLVRFHRLDEYKATQLAILRENLQLLTLAGITVVILHHNSRNNSFRGSSELSAMADSMIGLVKFNDGADKFILTVEKERTFCEDQVGQIVFSASGASGSTMLIGSRMNQPQDPKLAVKRKILRLCAEEPRRITELRQLIGGDVHIVDAAVKDLLMERPGLRMEKRKQAKFYFFHDVDEALDESEELMMMVD